MQQFWGQNGILRHSWVYWMYSILQLLDCLDESQVCMCISSNAPFFSHESNSHRRGQQEMTCLMSEVTCKDFSLAV